MAQSSDITQQRKKDAYEFALLLYDIYKEEEANEANQAQQEQETNESCQKPLSQ